MAGHKKGACLTQGQGVARSMGRLGGRSMQGSNFIHSPCYIFNCAAWTLPPTTHHSLIRKQRDNLSSSQDAALCSVRRTGWWTSGSHWISRFGYILLWQFS